MEIILPVLVFTIRSGFKDDALEWKIRKSMNITCQFKIPNYYPQLPPEVQPLQYRLVNQRHINLFCLRLMSLNMLEFNLTECRAYMVSRISHTIAPCRRSY